MDGILLLPIILRSTPNVNSHATTEWFEKRRKNRKFCGCGGVEGWFQDVVIAFQVEKVAMTTETSHK